MTRAELEDIIRIQITRAVSNALVSGTPSIGMLNRVAEEILRAADQYCETQEAGSRT